MDIGSVAMMLFLGALLSASCGLRAFIPPFLLACAGGLEWVELAPQFSWLATPIAIGTLGVAIILEILADKVPLVDHGMDLVHLLVKPLTGALAATTLVGGNDPMISWVVALIAGGTVAGATHLTKASIRVGSTATTAGTGNIVLSVIEDLVVLAISGGAIAGLAV